MIYMNKSYNYDMPKTTDEYFQIISKENPLEFLSKHIF